jgi:hypothetical protein
MLASLEHLEQLLGGILSGLFLDLHAAAFFWGTKVFFTWVGSPSGQWGGVDVGEGVLARTGSRRGWQPSSA